MMVDKGAARVNYVSAHRFSGNKIFVSRTPNFLQLNYELEISIA